MKLGEIALSRGNLALPDGITLIEPMMSVMAISQHLTRCETLTPTLKHHFHGSAHARLHMFRSSRSG
jgi:hypothetical protein